LVYAKKKIWSQSAPWEKNILIIQEMSAPAVAANQAMAANKVLSNIPSGVVSANKVNAAKAANNRVINAAKNVMNNQNKAVKAAANATVLPNKANAASVQTALNAVNRAMKNLQNLRVRAANANKNVVNSIIRNNRAVN